jgi:integrase
MKAKLTDLSVARQRPPKSGRLEIWDTLLPAFGLRLTAAGGRSWIVALRRPGASHPARIKLGEPPAMPLAEARDAARRLLADPSSLSSQEKQQTPEAVKAVVAEFIERYQKPRNRSWREVERVLIRELADWSDRPIREISRRDVIALLDRTADRAPLMANRLLAYVRKLFAWAVERGIVEASPVAGIKAPARERSRDRVLTEGELAAVWRALDGLHWPFGPAIKLLLVTAQRRDEVAHMAWPDLDLDARLWTLPRALTKADRVHEVPLSELAVDVIRALPRLGDGLVFPAARAGSSAPVSGWSKAKARLDALSGVRGWRLHDLRRTAASGMARLGHPPHVVAAILNHSPGATQGITAIYNRHRYGDEKRAALDDWARALGTLAQDGAAREPGTRVPGKLLTTA